MKVYEKGEVLNFLYNTQNRRRINPLYGIFTKEGLLYVIAGYILFVEMGKGVVVFVFYLGLGLYIYKEKLNYRFYQKERLYFYHRITEYLKHRENVPKYVKIIKFLTHKKTF